MINLDTAWIDFNCPNCSYICEVQLIDAKTEKLVYCHNCKTQLQLRDKDSSVHAGIDEVHEALREFEKSIKKLTK